MSVQSRCVSSGLEPHAFQNYILSLLFLLKTPQSYMGKVMLSGVVSGCVSSNTIRMVMEWQWSRSYNCLPRSSQFFWLKSLKMNIVMHVICVYAYVFVLNLLFSFPWQFWWPRPCGNPWKCLTGRGSSSDPIGHGDRRPEAQRRLHLEYER